MTITLADPEIGSDTMMLKGVDTTTKGPLFTVSEMATFFFARSSHWVRWLESCDFKEADPKRPSRQKACGRHPDQHTPSEAETHSPFWRLCLDGELLEPIRTKSGARQYDLALIERIAHALASNGTIGSQQLRHALMLVRIQAEMNEYLETEPFDRGVEVAPVPDEGEGES